MGQGPRGLAELAQVPEVRDEGRAIVKSLRDMTEPELRELCNGVANGVKARLPPRTLFTVLMFEDDGIAQYVSNANRAEMIKTLRETADRLESREDVAR
jgi:hypothetical protein